MNEYERDVAEYEAYVKAQEEQHARYLESIRRLTDDEICARDERHIARCYARALFAGKI